MDLNSFPEDLVFSERFREFEKRLTSVRNDVENLNKLNPQFQTAVWDSLKHLQIASVVCIDRKNHHLFQDPMSGSIEFYNYYSTDAEIDVCDKGDEVSEIRRINRKIENNKYLLKIQKLTGIEDYSVDAVTEFGARLLREALSVRDGLVNLIYEDTINLIIYTNNVSKEPINEENPEYQELLENIRNSVRRNFMDFRISRLSLDPNTIKNNLLMKYAGHKDPVDNHQMFYLVRR